MANLDQLAILAQGVDAWNQWRIEHANMRPDLSRADLSDANLSRANLSDADLAEADLSDANLFNADLGGANLSDADLNRANLCLANFSLADLRAAHLSGADLTGAILTYANLSDANLLGANLSRAIIGSTSFGDRDLREIKGLETILHIARSPLSINTLLLSEGDIAEAFVRGTGAPDTFIDYMRSLVGKPIAYYSCFISYSSKDQEFTERLYADLQSNNVRCWFAPEDLKWGERIRSGIDEAIRLHDKLLLILSRHSVASGWVEHEVKTVLAKERKEKRTVLFPVRLDKAVLESPYAWATEIRHERNMGDFTQWRDHNEYQKAFTRLLRDLKAETGK